MDAIRPVLLTLALQKHKTGTIHIKVYVYHHTNNTFKPSVILVNMTIVESRCSQIILQKSLIVLGMGP